MSRHPLMIFALLFLLFYLYGISFSYADLALNCGGPHLLAVNPTELNVSVTQSGSTLVSGPTEAVIVDDQQAQGYGTCIPVSCCLESTNLSAGSTVNFLASTNGSSTTAVLLTPESNFSTTQSAQDLFGTMTQLTTSPQTVVTVAPNQVFCGSTSNTFLTKINMTAMMIEPALNSIQCAFIPYSNPAGTYIGSLNLSLSAQ